MKAKTRIIKKLLLFPIVVIILMLLNSCGSSVKLIYTSNQIKQSTDTTTYKSIRKAFWSDSLVVKTNDKKKQMLAPDAIWGCVYNNNIYYRYYRKRFFFVRQMDSLFIYSIYHSGGTSSRHTHFYFSKTPDSKIFSLNNKTIGSQFSGNSCLLNKLNDLKWYQSLSSYDKKKQSYRITELYKECN